MDKSQLPLEIGVLMTDPNISWTKGDAGFEDFLDNFVKNAADNIQFHVAGQEFDFGGDANGVEETKSFLKNKVLPGVLGALDTTKPLNREVVNVIGGGPGKWCALDMIATGTSKKGKKYHHESVMLLKANDQGKWEEVKMFCDTLHLQKHKDDQKHK